MPVLIVSDLGDAHIPFVGRHLTEEPVIIGSESLVKDKGLDFSLTKDRAIIQYDGQELLSPTSVWFRKPSFRLQESLPISPTHQKYVESSVMHHIRGMYPLLESSFWVSDFYAILRAASKPLQLQRASKIGFNTPQTLFTSSQESAARFLKTHDTCIVKSQASAFPTDTQSNTAQVFFARKIEKGEQINLDGLNLGPAIFQEAIDTDFDIRVTVIGKKVFASAVRTDIKEKEFDKTLDWRAGHHSGQLNFEPFELPPSIVELCVRHVADLGLRFGAIDLVQDKKGTIWYLENNPNGQWAFVEEATGQPIGKAMAELLETHKL